MNSNSAFSFNMRFIGFLMAIIAFQYLVSCSTAVDTNGPAADTPVVYMILNPDSAYQYVRLNKTFVNSNGLDARLIAKNDPSAYNFGAGDVTMTLYEVDNGKDTAIATFEPVTLSNKDTGLFAAPDQILYKSVAPVNLKSDKRIGTSGNRKLNYKLEGVHKVSGAKFSATTTSVSNFQIFYPVDGINIDVYHESRESSLFIAIQSDNCNGADIVSCLGGANSVANFEIKYRQYLDDDTFKDTTLQYRNFLFPYTTSMGTGDFFNFLVNKIKPNSRVRKRVFLPSNVLLYIANKDFVQYLDVLNNYNPITQIRPVYSNVSGGIGLLAFRRSKSATVNISDKTVRDMNSVSGSSPNYPNLYNLKFNTK